MACLGLIVSLAKPAMPMPPIEDLEAQALSLPPEERARLVERLIASFEPKSAAQAAWMQLAQRRREDVRAGRAVMATGEQALARVKARLA
jgi:putative addiction module component (TIGR02574 family)